MAIGNWGEDELIWRATTGITDVEISSAQWQTFLSEAEDRVVKDGFRFKRYEYTYKQTDEERYYTRHHYIADGNKDNSVDKTDIKVYEIDENFSYHDISAQVDQFN
ncbi:MAG: hypothetical protein ACTSR2_02570, partial [Candidatus Hodarchaeales archaeon]